LELAVPSKEGYNGCSLFFVFWGSQYFLHLLNMILVEPSLWDEHTRVSIALGYFFNDQVFYLDPKTLCIEPLRYIGIEDYRNF